MACGRRVSFNIAGLLVLAAAANLMLAAAAATTHTVGGNNGWTLPSINTEYSDWASAQTFAVGDALVFNFESPHSVVEVPKAGYDSCNTSNKIGFTLTSSSSPFHYILATAGNHYYVCTTNLHCSLGQKLAITVLPSVTMPSAPPGTVIIVGGSSIVDGSSAAPSSLPSAATCSLALLSFAFYFLL